MKTRLTTVVAAVLAWIIVSAPVSAHHGAALFDTTKALTLKATVTDWIWANPHCILKFDVKDEKGDVVHWAAEVQNPSDMSNRGWARLSFKAGDKVTVVLTPVKNGAPVGRILRVELADGQVFKAVNDPAAPGGPSNSAR